MPAAQQGPATRAELRHGALVAWLTFMVLLVLVVVAVAVVGEATANGYLPAFLVLPAVVLYTVVLGGAVSGLLTLLALPVASRLDRALPGDISSGARVAAFAGLGVAPGLVGAAIVALLLAGAGNDPALAFFSPITLTAVVMTAIAATAGRWYALRRARKEEISRSEEQSG